MNKIFINIFCVFGRYYIFKIRIGCYEMGIVRDKEDWVFWDGKCKCWYIKF